MFEVLFKYPLEHFARGSYELAVAFPVWLGLFVLLTLGVWWGLRYSALPSGGRRLITGALRFALLAIVLTLLLDPLLVTPSRSTDGSQLVFAIDASASMAPAGDNGARVAAIAQLLSPDEGVGGDELAQRFDTRLAAIGTQATLLQSTAALQLTQGHADWAGALMDLTVQHPGLSNIVVVSDGRLVVDEALEHTLVSLRARGVRVDTIRTPSVAGLRDVSVESVDVPRRARLGDEIVAAVRVGYTNSVGRKAEVRIEDDGLLVERKEVSIPAGSGALDVNVIAPLGSSGYRHMQVLLLTDAPDDVPANNQLSFGIDVRDDVIDVLHFEAEPRFEVKFARRALNADANIKLVSLVRTAENKFYRLGIKSADELVDGFPRDPAELHGYEMIIIGSVGSEDLDPLQQRALMSFVRERGGGVLFLGGRRALAQGGLHKTEVSSMLPVVLEPDPPGFRERLAIEAAPLARPHPVATLALGRQGTKAFVDMPALTIINPIRATKPGATRLLYTRTQDGQSAPWVGLATHRYGRGQVAVMPVRDFWRWQMHSSVPLEDQTHELAWRYLVRWLGGSAAERLEVSVSPRSVTPGELVNVDVRLLDDMYEPARNSSQLKLFVQGDEQAKVATDVVWRSLGDGQFRAQIRAPQAQTVRFEVAAQSEEKNAERPDAMVAADTVQVSALGRELRTLRRDTGGLQWLAVQSGGRSVQWEEAKGLLDSLRPEPRDRKTFERLPLWNLPAALVLILLLASAEWIARRRWGLK